MIRLSSKNDKSSLCYDVIITHQKKKRLKIDKFNDFSSGIDFNSKTDIFRDVIYLIINQCEPRHPQGKRSALVVNDFIQRITLFAT